MPKAKLEAATLAGSADDTESAFYDALQHGDLDKLMACWADEDDIVCVHPGGPRVLGLAAIRANFEAMFSNGTLHVMPERVRKIESLSSAVHNLVERIDVMTPEGRREAFVIATNVYLKTVHGWRLVAHHASPGTLNEMQEQNDGGQVLH